MKKIGYQGIVGSNSYDVSRRIAAQLGWEDAQFVPLVSSQGVVDGLVRREVDFGVMAVRNKIAGEVIETRQALEGLACSIVETDKIPIHHDLFVKDASVTEVSAIASHIQALKQCRGTLAQYFPGAKLMEIEDTAIGARYLSDGTLSADIGVLCRRDAGEKYGLHLLRANLEDDKENATEFIMIRLEG